MVVLSNQTAQTIKRMRKMVEQSALHFYRKIFDSHESNQDSIYHSNGFGVFSFKFYTHTQ